MTCMFKNANDKKCNHQTQEKTRFCSKHKNTFQAREENATIFKIFGTDYLLQNKQISSYIEGLKIFPLRSTDITILNENGFGSFINETIRNL